MTNLVRSKNAGPFEITIDIMFSEPKFYRGTIKQKVISPEKIAKIYGVSEQLIRIFSIPSIHAIKVSFPRNIIQGSIGDADNHGGQQYAPLLDLEVDV